MQFPPQTHPIHHGPLLGGLLDANVAKHACAEGSRFSAWAAAALSVAPADYEMHCVQNWPSGLSYSSIGRLLQFVQITSVHRC